MPVDNVLSMWGTITFSVYRLWFITHFIWTTSCTWTSVSSARERLLNLIAHSLNIKPEKKAKLNQSKMCCDTIYKKIKKTLTCSSLVVSQGRWRYDDLRQSLIILLCITAPSHLWSLDRRVHRLHHQVTQTGLAYSWWGRVIAVESWVSVSCSWSIFCDRFCYDGLAGGWVRSWVLRCVSHLHRNILNIPWRVQLRIVNVIIHLRWRGMSCRQYNCNRIKHKWNTS